MKNKYVDEIKKIIETTANRIENDGPLFLSKLMGQYPIISSQCKIIFNIHDYPKIDDTTFEKYFETAKKEYLSINQIKINPSNSLTKKGFVTWLTKDLIQGTDWNYSERYFRYLEKIGRAESVIEEIENSSLSILKKIGNPKSGTAFYEKGIVVGSVQSGKTGNFNAVINRAIDSGYGLIIVLSGIMEDLRSQTQKRIESDVIGTGVIDEEKDIKGTKGVGKISRFGNQGNNEIEQVISITSYKSDFNKSLADADADLDHTNILICKKNVSVLRNLIVWLHDYLEDHKGKHKIPLLIIDDEADNASLNNEGHKGREYASKINGHIRALLDLFEKKTYLGYTATPFANVLQDRNDKPENNWTIKYKFRGDPVEKTLPQVANLFPDDFIELLDAPSNYIGAKQIFETTTPIENKKEEKIPLLEVVDDYIDTFPSRVYDTENGETYGVEHYKDKSDFEARNDYIQFESYSEYRRSTRASKSLDNFPHILPKSLNESIICFIISIAIRDSRKPLMMNSGLYNQHHTMLVHISRFTLWQNKTKDLILEYVKEIKTRLNNDSIKSPTSIYLDFERIWYKYYAVIIEEIQSYLPSKYNDDFMAPITFEALIKYLVDAAEGVEVKAINSSTNDKLFYTDKTSKKVIAVGGNRLSRGFTLEGLTINYFVRMTNYSDTLLQMGRWFGYRPGYLDCCKLFTTKDSIDKFDSTTRAIEELEEEFKKMEDKERTPENFVLRVRKHPGTLKVTRPSILKNAMVVKWSYQDQLEQTTTFDVSKNKILKVWKYFKLSLAHKFKSIPRVNDFLSFQTDIPGIIEILKMENNFDKDSASRIIKFIKLCKNKGKLTKWTVAIKTTGNAMQLKEKDSNLAADIDMAIRRGPSEKNIFHSAFVENKIFKPTGKSANIISNNKDLALLLTGPEIKTAEQNFIQKRKKKFIQSNKLSEEEALKKAQKIHIPEYVYREQMSDQNALLIIYLIDLHYVFLQEKGKENQKLKQMVKDEGYDLNIPLVGYALAFPPIYPDPGGEYLQGDYNLVDDEDEETEYTHEDNELPEDAEED